MSNQPLDATDPTGFWSDSCAYRPGACFDSLPTQPGPGSDSGGTIQPSAAAPVSPASSGGMPTYNGGADPGASGEFTDGSVSGWGAVGYAAANGPAIFDAGRTWAKTAEHQPRIHEPVAMSRTAVAVDGAVPNYGSSPVGLGTGSGQEIAPFPHESPSADSPRAESPPNWGPADWQDVLKRARWQNSQRIAAYLFLDKQNPTSIIKDREFYTFIVEKDGKFAELPAQIGGRSTSTGFNEYLQSFKDANIRGVKLSAWVHTHGADTPEINDEIFSAHRGGDADTARALNLKGYLGTPRGRFLELLPGQTIGTDLGALPPSPMYSAP